MAIIVEHEKRRHEILTHALDIFVEEGYEGATFQKIADRCGITRTTLYLYFKNKHEIFIWSIKQLTNMLEAEIRSLINNSALTSAQRLYYTILLIVDNCSANKKLFRVVLLYLFQLPKDGENPDDRVKRRTIRLRHLLSSILIKGVKDGEFKPISVKAVNELLYAFIESVVFRLSVLRKDNTDELKSVIQILMDGVCVNEFVILETDDRR